MTALLTVIHVVFCLFLILVILLQTGKGAGIGAAFGGGGSQTVFGPRGAGSFIGKLTGIVAALFMLTSFSLAYVSSSKTSGIAQKMEALNEEISSGQEVDLTTETGQSLPETDTAATAKATDGDTKTATAKATDGGTEAAPAPPAAAPGQASPAPTPAAPSEPTPTPATGETE